MKLPNAQNAIVDERKVREYLLSPSHPVGRSHQDADITCARLTRDLELEEVSKETGLIAELDLSAKYRRKKRDRDFSLFSTHPNPESRMADLKVSAAEVRQPGQSYDARRARYVSALAAIRPTLLDDQVKLNDPGASQYVVSTLAKDGWTGLLLFHEGEIWRLRNRKEDQLRAAQGYAAAVGYPDAPADAWRWHGIMLMKAGRNVEARAAFARYLAMAPNAPDAAFVRQMMAS